MAIPPTMGIGAMLGPPLPPGEGGVREVEVLNALEAALTLTPLPGGEGTGGGGDCLDDKKEGTLT
jgi:hypothetical protein